MSEAANSLVTVIIPVFNAANYVSDALHSILDQTHCNLELIIIDDGSTDASYEILKGIDDDRVRLFQNEQNIGYLKTVNRAFQLAKGAYITFQDADDVSAPDRISILLDEFKFDKELILCGSQCYFVNENHRSRSFYPCQDHDIRRAVEQGETAIFCGATIMVKSDVLTKIGGYREIFDRLGSEDVDWIYRIMMFGKIKNIDKALYSYRFEPCSITKSLSLNPLRYQSANIVKALKQQRDESGVDITDSSDTIKTELFLRQFERPYIDDPAKIYRDAGIEQLSFGNLQGYFNCGRRAQLETGLNVALFKYWFMFLPILVLSFIPMGYRKRIFRILKRLRAKAL